MGGHSAGQLASRATADALSGLEARASFPDFVRAVRESLAEVNRYLYSLSQRAVNPTVIGTTVVVLLIRDGTGVCLWAGDSRLYRRRGDALEQLTIDHSEVNESQLDSLLAPSNVITRALGGHDEIDLEQVSFDVQSGDRFMLCSDGLYRELSHEDLRSMLANGDAAGTADAMIERVLHGEASDNVTVFGVAAKRGAA
jgi:serine/threonine protein phosphatase PrpC